MEVEVFVMLGLVLAGGAHAADACEKAVAKAAKHGQLAFNVGDGTVVHQQGSTFYSTTFYREGHGPPLQAGWTMAAKLEDGSDVQLAVAERVEAVERTNETGTLTFYEPVFVVTPEQVVALAASPIDAVRIDIGSGGGPTSMAKGKSKKLHAAFACIAQQD